MLAPLKRKGVLVLAIALNILLMERLQVSYQKWLLTIYLVVTAGKGILSMQQGVKTQKKTVWQMLHCIKNAYAEVNEKLGNVVGMEETCTNSSEINRHTSKQKKMRGIMGVILLLKWSLIQDGETRCS